MLNMNLTFFLADATERILKILFLVNKMKQMLGNGITGSFSLYLFFFWPRNTALLKEAKEI